MSIDDNYMVLRRVLDSGVIRYGWAAEFGVYSGASICIIADYMPVIGFDSFEGLPEDWRPDFPKGTFSDRLPTLPAYGHNVMIQKGWFKATAPTFPFPPLSLVHIDCDLYSSTVTALNSVQPSISPGTVLVFDEYEGVDFDDEKRAFHEWLQLNYITASLLDMEGESAAFVIEDMG